MSEIRKELQVLGDEYDLLRSRNEQLVRALRFYATRKHYSTNQDGSVAGVENGNVAREALSAEPEQGEPAVDTCPICREKPEDLDWCGGPFSWCPAPTPGGGEGALEAWERVKTTCQRCMSGGSPNAIEAMFDDLHIIHRALREPRVPEAVRRLPGELRAGAQEIEGAQPSRWRLAQAAQMRLDADQLDRALKVNNDV